MHIGVYALYWCLHTHTGVYTCVLVSTHAYWCLHMHIGVYTRILVSTYAYWCLHMHMPIPVAARSKAWVCGSSLADYGFESRRGHGCLSLTSVLCCQRSLRRADHSSRGVLLRVVCLSVIAKPRQRGGPSPLGAVASRKKKRGEPCSSNLLKPSGNFTYDQV
jgi:hypothetical protein